MSNRLKYLSKLKEHFHELRNEVDKYWRRYSLICLLCDDIIDSLSKDMLKCTVYEMAREVCKDLLFKGRDILVLAASVIYLAAQKENIRITQEDISNEVGVPRSALRKNITLIGKCLIQQHYITRDDLWTPYSIWKS